MAHVRAKTWGAMAAPAAPMPPPLIKGVEFVIPSSTFQIISRNSDDACSYVQISGSKESRSRVFGVMFEKCKPISFSPVCVCVCVRV